MSLHLIESRVPSRVLLLRRPGGNAVSLAMHAVLVTMAVIATASPPRFLSERPRVIDHVVYVAPKSPPMAQPAQATSSSSASASPVATQPPLLAPLDIPLTIPDVPDVTTSPVHDLDVHAMFNRVLHGQGALGGTSTETSSGRGNAVHDSSEVDVPVLALSCAPPPRYPESLRAAGIQDTVLASFVVDTTGRIEPNSLSFAGSPHAAFIASVREALGRSCFRPAEARGRRVRQLVKQPFVFSLTR